ncbi:MAG: tetratricopeptide repeat protein, partial [Pseudomonadota bacterium]
MRSAAPNAQRFSAWRQTAIIVAIAGAVIAGLALIPPVVGLGTDGSQADTAALARQLYDDQQQLRIDNTADVAARDDEIQRLKDALDAIQQTPAATAGESVEDALELAATGDTEPAQRILLNVQRAREAEGRESLAAAEAARHRGALAFVYDTEAALNAYREATELDPTNFRGWSQLGHLQRRIGALNAAAESYERALSISDAASDAALRAIALGNLGLVAQTRGDLDAAEDFHRRSLALDEEL